MKKYFSFAMALVAMLAMVSASSGCSDDGVDYSVTIVAKTTLSLSKNAGTGRLAYEIQGADKSSIVEATTNVDWIKNFNYAEPGYVQFDYTALDEGVESRSGQITLSYTGAADVVVYHDVRTYDRSEVDYGKRLCNADRSFERERDLSVRFYD